MNSSLRCGTFVFSTAHGEPDREDRLTEETDAVKWTQYLRVLSVLVILASHSALSGCEAFAPGSREEHTAFRLPLTSDVPPQREPKVPEDESR